MPLTVQFDDDELPDLQRLLNRALNTWDRPPAWAIDLDRTVEDRLNRAQSDHDNPPQVPCDR